MNYKKLCLFTMTILGFTACKKTSTDTSLPSDTKWINKENLSATEIMDSIVGEVDRSNSFKYTSENSANVNFFGGQKTNTFILDKKGNAMSNRNGEQNYRIDGQVYWRRIGLKESGLMATVISDVMNKDETDKEYFDRNIPYIKKNGVINIEFLKDCPFTTSVSGNTLTITVDDLSKTSARNKEWMRNVILTYTPHKEFKCRINFQEPEREPKTLTYTFTFDPDEEVELPTLMKIGTSLSAIK